MVWLARSDINEHTASPASPQMMDLYAEKRPTPKHDIDRLGKSHFLIQSDRLYTTRTKENHVYRHRPPLI